jgi:energy-coupling factor transporter transmembrane protein EcfT
VGAAIGLLYLAKVYGKFKWRSLKFFLFSAFCFLLLIFGVCFFWNNTPDNAPWYLKRLDLSRGSAQHRVAAWKAGFEMMCDHPFGVGWNKAVGTYAKEYSPPEGGAAAITTNDYLMLGTQLGLPGLVCFVAYVGLALKTENRKQKAEIIQKAESGKRKAEIENRPDACVRSCDAIVAESEDDASSPSPAASQTALPIFSRDGGIAATLCNEASQLRCACRAGALAMLVAFWFDGGLFKLATASVFWILLELGSERQKLKTEMLKAETNLSLVPTSPGCGAASRSIPDDQQVVPTYKQKFGP